MLPDTVLLMYISCLVNNYNRFTEALVMTVATKMGLRQKINNFIFDKTCYKTNTLPNNHRMFEFSQLPQNFITRKPCYRKKTADAIRFGSMFGENSQHV